MARLNPKEMAASVSGLYNNFCNDGEKYVAKRPATLATLIKCDRDWFLEARCQTEPIALIAMLEDREGCHGFSCCRGALSSLAERPPTLPAGLTKV